MPRIDRSHKKKRKRVELSRPSVSNIPLPGGDESILHLSTQRNTNNDSGHRNVQSMLHNSGDRSGVERKSSPRLRAARVETATASNNTVGESTAERKRRRRKRGDIVQDDRKIDRSRIDSSRRADPNISDDSDILGDDGNLFHCHICHDVGDVVCCDGCPKVYHVDCIPMHSESRLSLNRDDNPWYCPDCWDDGSMTVIDDDGNMSYCHVCRDVGDVVCCDGCPKVYHLECIPVNSASRLSLDRNDNPWYCPDCRENKHLIIPKKNEPIIEADRKSPGYAKDVTVPSDEKEIFPPKTQLIVDNYRSDSASSDESSRDENDAYVEHLKSSKIEPITNIKATSPFHLYIIHNRLGIERSLKGDNDFKRAKKGVDRNLLIAKEAARRWRKTSIQERKKYIDQSMQEYEKKLIDWKQELIIRDMMGLLEYDQKSGDVKESESSNGDKSRFDRIQALSKLPSHPTIWNSHLDSLLSQLLEDQRFRNIQLISPSRSDDIWNTDTENSILSELIVQGPTSTMVGDVCPGCARGWNHFCPVIKRFLPAIELRSMMQPPVSTLMATRVGIGCFKDKSIMESDERNVGSDAHRVDTGSKNLSEILCHYDEVVSFLEAATMLSQIKPDHSRPNRCFVCPGCKTKHDLQYGCLPCRRRKLIHDITRSGSTVLLSNKTGKDLSINHSVTTNILRQSEWKLNNFTNQKKDETTFAKAMLANSWKPNAVMPFPPIDIVSDEASIDGDDQQVESADECDCKSEIIHHRNLRLSNRLKSNQSKTEKSAPMELEPEHCQDLAIEHRDESVALQKHCLTVAILGILGCLVRRDPLGLFAKPVPDTVESYKSIVTYPIDFSVIRSKALEGKYSSIGSFIGDVRILCKNAQLYNLPSSIYAITANELIDTIDEMQSRAIKWMNSIRIAHAAHFNRRSSQNAGANNKGNTMTLDDISVTFDHDLIKKLRGTWPGAVEIIENSRWLRSLISSNIVRTKENECALYGLMAIRRAREAANVSKTFCSSVDKVYAPSIIRNDKDDEALRECIDSFVSKFNEFSGSANVTSWRENQLFRCLKRLQDRRLEELSSSTSGCARCDNLEYDYDGLIKNPIVILEKMRAANTLFTERVDSSRAGVNLHIGNDKIAVDIDSANDSDRYRYLSVRGSRIHGWGLFAEKAFKKGEVVAEYVGEWIGNAVADARERQYKNLRIQDYQFRVSSDLVVDATMKGGYARYINHSCEPNCVASISDEALKRIFIICERDIEPFEEITYDYQFPLELSPDLRIPCTCRANRCRGFMNWDIPSVLQTLGE